MSLGVTVECLLEEFNFVLLHSLTWEAVLHHHYYVTLEVH